MNGVTKWFCGTSALLVAVLSVVIWRMTPPARIQGSGVVELSGGFASDPMDAFPSNPPGSDGARLSPSGSGVRPLQNASRPSTSVQDPEGVSYDAITASRIAERYDEAPEESILWGTVEIWSDPTFQEWVGERVSSYPTAEDARLALESSAVQRAYFDFLVADCIAIEFELSPDAPRQLVENARRAYETAEVDLWRALDKGSAYRDWERLGMLWREFDQ